MILKHIKLRNWKNFRSVDLNLTERTFVVGANASGKSNLLDVFRFMRDLVKPVNGGLQSAVSARGGMKKLRCINAREHPQVEIDIAIGPRDVDGSDWRYLLSINSENAGKRRVLVHSEEAWGPGGKTLMPKRPSKDEQEDKERLTRTALENPSANRSFREISDFFRQVAYLHLVPQMLRRVDSANVEEIGDDYYGRNFLVRVSKTPEKIRKSRLRRIEKALKLAVPRFSELRDIKDEAGVPHLEARLSHWRPNGAWQREDQFSDGTIRLIGLCWSLLESDSLMLFEEPELSLNDSIVEKLPELLWELQSAKGRQVILSTHSYSLLSDAGIQPGEVVILKPGDDGTIASLASKEPDVVAAVKGGMPIGQAVLPLTNPENIAAFTL